MTVIEIEPGEVIEVPAGARLGPAPPVSKEDLDKGRDHERE